jgi:hypothetical protein
LTYDIADVIPNTRPRPGEKSVGEENDQSYKNENNLSQSVEHQDAYPHTEEEMADQDPEVKAPGPAILLEPNEIKMEGIVIFRVVKVILSKVHIGEGIQPKAEEDN